MKLFINGEEYCDATLLGKHDVSYHEFGRAAATGGDTKATLELTEALVVGANDQRRFELREGQQRHMVSPYGATDRYGHIPVFIEKRLPPIPSSHGRPAKLYRRDEEVSNVYDWAEVIAGGTEGGAAIDMGVETKQKPIKAWKLLCAKKPIAGDHALRLGPDELWLNLEGEATEMVSQKVKCWRCIATSDVNASFPNGQADLTFRPSLSRANFT